MFNNILKTDGEIYFTEIIGCERGVIDMGVIVEHCKPTNIQGGLNVLFKKLPDSG